MGALSQRGGSCVRFPFVDNNLPKPWLPGCDTNLPSVVEDTRQLRPGPYFFSHVLELNFLSLGDSRSIAKASAFKGHTAGPALVSLPPSPGTRFHLHPFLH